MAFWSLCNIKLIKINKYHWHTSDYPGNCFLDVLTVRQCKRGCLNSWCFRALVVPCIVMFCNYGNAGVNGRVDLVLTSSVFPYFFPSLAVGDIPWGHVMSAQSDVSAEKKAVAVLLCFQQYSASNSPIGGWCMAVRAITWLINEWVRVFPQSRGEEIYFAMSMSV